MSFLITGAKNTNLTTNTSSYASGSFTALQGDLLIVFVVSSDTAAAGGLTSSSGLTFTKIVSQAYSTGTVYAFVSDAVPTSTSGHACTFTCTGDAATGASIAVLAFRPQELDTRYGMSAIKQYAVNSGSASSTPSVSLTNLTTLNNSLFLGVGMSTNPPSLTPETGYTEMYDTGYSTPTTGMWCATKEVENGVRFDLAANSLAPSAWAAIGLEIDTTLVPVANSSAFFAFF